ncbi:hypothetical protein BJX68DRAFT_274141 [Aspergillus pseudodeflectus]|uniref:Zn(2)-C6 fungal-type domain-containing protein n=1 Tax=Aspergillus pseudodeflectus TaxID=176178 RepID=A0ABR4KSC2_9EURO
MMDKNTKMANHAWRKKPRRSAPKSRLGCRTCKIRRIKCDLSRPSCLRCSSTGRTCDGYNEMPHALKIENTKTSGRHCNRKADTVESCDKTCHSCTITRTSQPRPKPGHGLIPQNLEPFMVLPMTEPGHAEAVRFFEYHSIKRLNEYNPCQSWRETLMFFSQTVPAVRSAAVALALIQRKYLDCNGRPQCSDSKLEDGSPDKAPLFYYNRAIELLLTQEVGDGIHATAITLLVCYLFICFDHLAGNDVQAVKHLRGGMELARTINKDTLHYGHGHDDFVQPSKTRSLICQVARQIRRLDMQAVTFMVDWTPADIREEEEEEEEEEIFMSSQQLPLLCDNSNDSSAFCSLDHAADTLQILVARVVRLCNTGQQVSPLGKMPPLPSSLGDVVLTELETWSALFENMLLAQGGNLDRMMESESRSSFVSLLRLQHTIARILVSTAGPGREIEYDKYTPQFEQCVALAGAVAASSSSYSGSSSLINNPSRKAAPTATATATATATPAFTPEIGIVPVLYIIGVKCRHPVVRRDALNILRRHRIREAIWDSVVTARVVERVIKIEEGGNGEEKGQGQAELVQSAADIPAGRRVQALSFVVEAGGGGRADITYTFCAREGVYVESLVI